MVEFEKTVDRWFGPALCTLAGILSVPILRHLPISPKRILIVRLWAMGEALLVLPMVEALRKRYPDAKIDVLATKRVEKVFENIPFINNILLFGPKCLGRFHSYDLIVDTEPYLNISALSGWYLGKYRIGFSHGVRSLTYSKRIRFNDQQHEVFTFMDLVRPLGVLAHPEKLVALHVSSTADAAIKKMLGKCPRPWIGVCATAAESASYLRRWPYFVEAGKELVQKTRGTLIFVGTKEDRAFVETITHQLPAHHAFNAAGKTSFEELIALVSSCDVFISNDTGPMHLAAAQGIPTLGLFGPNLPIRFAPFGKKNSTLFHKIPCSPCINVHKGEIDAFSCKNNLCMQLISVESVIKKTIELLKRSN